MARELFLSKQLYEASCGEVCSRVSGPEPVMKVVITSSRLGAGFFQGKGCLFESDT